METSNFSFISYYLQKSSRNPYVDIFVAIITVPTLILLALLLDANIQENIETTVETRSSFIVLIFGFAFLVISSLVCGCIVHKMGLCRWNRRTEEEPNTANRVENVDCVHVIDLPPTYESVTSQNNELPKVDSSSSLSSITKPPPSYEIACSKEKLDQSNTTVHHI